MQSEVASEQHMINTLLFELRLARKQAICTSAAHTDGPTDNGGGGLVRLW